MGRYISAEEFERMAGTEAGAEIDMQIGAAEGMIDRYLNRQLLSGDCCEVFCPEDAGAVLLLRAYPVEKIDSVTDEAGEAAYRLNAESGILRLKQPARGDVTVTYSGGYAVLPDEIKYAAVLLVQTLRNAAEHGGLALMSERLGDYQVMYFNQEGAADSLPALSRAAAALLAPFRARVT